MFRSADNGFWPRGSHPAQPRRRTWGGFLICATRLIPNQSSAMSKYRWGPCSWKLQPTTGAGNRPRPELRRCYRFAHPWPVGRAKHLQSST
jgi:hypothetical protein